MTRRLFLATPLLMAASARGADPLVLPVNLVIDGKSRPSAGQLERFRDSLWPEAVRDLGRAGIGIRQSERAGEMERPSQREPIITGLARRELNVVVTDQIPMYWDQGRGANGVTLLYRGFHLCVVALNFAHGHMVPLVSVNTCLHEILHALLGDIFERRPVGWRGQAREAWVDTAATRMWLFGDGGTVRDSARSYLAELARTAETN